MTERNRPLLHTVSQVAEYLRTLLESDFLLLVDDGLRMGALRFRSRPQGPFLAEPRPRRVPPLVELGRLLRACDRVTNRSDAEEDLRMLLVPGSSLGGARPKAAVRDSDGALAIAKFPRPDDERDMVLWEAVSLTLAGRAGIAVPVWRIESVAGRRVLVSRRFDRAGSRRVPFLSAMSMLGAVDNEPRSYLEIADALRMHGAAARQDLSELWRRVVFNLLVSNTDDHLRNHGFLHEAGLGWRLSPAYDLNRTPTDERARVLSTHIDENDGTASLSLALETAGYYGLSASRAKRIAGEVGAVVSGWRGAASRLGATEREADRMESAFVHEDLDQAVGLA
jgi:serine/threonine-protein kinase HipA